jgi:hypothetical protein
MILRRIIDKNREKKKTSACAKFILSDNVEYTRDYTTRMNMYQRKKKEKEKERFVLKGIERKYSSLSYIIFIYILDLRIKLFLFLINVNNDINF